MAHHEPHHISVSHEADVILARQAAVTLCIGTGFDRTRSHVLATAVSELASNLLAHTPAGGTVELSAIELNGRVGVEVDCSDDGPGIADVNLALSEGYSSNGGLGGGLPGVRRLVDEFTITSQTGDHAFTQIKARLWLPRS